MSGKKQASPPRWIMWITFLALPLGILLVGRLPQLSRTTATEPLETSALHVATVAAQHDDHFSIARSYLGQIESRRQSELSFEFAGKLLRVLVDEGDRVMPGQVVAELDSEILKSQHQSMNAQVMAAKARLLELQNGPREEVIRAAKADVIELESQLRLATSTKNRLERLIDSQAVSREEFENSTFNEQAIYARLEAARARLAELVHGTRPEQIAAQQAICAQLEAERQTIKIQIRKSQLLAPYRGVIFNRLVDDGAVIQTGQVVLEIFDDENMEVRVGLPVQIVPQAGAEHQATFVYHNQQVPAAFKSVRPAKNQTTRTVDAIYSLEPMSMVPVLGDVIEVRLERQISRTGLWIPAHSLVENYRGLWGCFVVETDSDGQQRASLRELELIHREGNRVYVTGALKADDPVIASGVHRLVANQFVQASPRAREDTTGSEHVESRGDR